MNRRTEVDVRFSRTVRCHARSVARAGSHRRRPARSPPARDGSRPIARRDRHARNRTPPADSGARGAEAPAEHVGRRGRESQAAGPRHDGDPGRQPHPLAADPAAWRSARWRSSTSSIRRCWCCPICRTRACRTAPPPPTTSKFAAAASRGGSTSRRSRIGIWAPRSASSTSSAPPALPAPGFRC